MSLADPNYLALDVAALADPRTLAKGEQFIERFREIVSDPLNLMIERVPEAGYVDGDGFVILHNGNRADVAGPYAYYADFSRILILNRGVHEPLEEFCFQQMLRKVSPDAPLMLELGAYWGHYSMWLKRVHPSARCILVEPDPHNSACGRENFARNGLAGEFIVDFVGEAGFGVDRFGVAQGIETIDVLHADIQGYELEMLGGAAATLAARRARYVFVSTHSTPLHHAVSAALAGHGYRIEVSSEFAGHTTSYDGFIMASAPDAEPVFAQFQPLGRLEIARASAAEKLASLTAIRT